LRARYTLALGVIALIALVQFVLLSRFIGDGKRVATTINVAGRQRMWDQRIAFFAQRVVATTDPSSRAERRGALLDAVTQMEYQAAQLANGNPALNPPDWPPPSVRALLSAPPTNLIAGERAYFERARALGAVPDEALRADSPDLTYILDHQAAILLDLDRAVNAYVADGNERQRRLQIDELATFIALVLVLGILLFIVLDPMERRIEQQQSVLRRENANLSLVVAGARALSETLEIDGLLGRFRQSAGQMLGVPVRLLTLDDVAQLPEARRDLVATAMVSPQVIVSADETVIAMAIDAYGGSPAVAMIAEHTNRFRAMEISALELFAANLRLAAYNARLFAEVHDRQLRVAELDKLKSDLIAMLAHDFRSPLTSIIGFAELLKEGLIKPEDIGDTADSIAAAAWRLTALAADTLTMAQLERNEVTLERSQLDIRDLLRDAASDVLKQRVVRIEGEGATVLGDSRRLRQVFDNLLSNAIKYSPGNEPIVVRLTQRAASVAIDVIDTGIGIPAAEVDRVFDRFARGSNAREAKIKGTGFGLYLSRMLVELHGGAISVVSREGIGSTFTITLPTLDRAPALV